MRKTLSAIFAIGLMAMGVVEMSAQKTAKSRALPSINVDRNSTFDEVHAYSDGTGVWVTWSMADGKRALGYDVYRLTNAGREMVTQSPIVGGAVDRGFFINDGMLGDVFEVEAIRHDGTRFLSERVSVETVARIEDVAGRTAAEMIASPASNGNIESSTLVLPSDLSSEYIKTQQRPNLANQRAMAVQAGAKIGIKKDGFYRVTSAELTAAGFNTATDRTKWQLFAGGVEQAIIVHPAGDYIEFYAKAIDLIETDTRFYYLYNGTVAGKRIGTRVARPVSSPVIAKSYRSEFKLTRKFNYIYDIINGDADNFWGDIILTNPVNLTFNLTGIDTTSAKSQLNIAFQGFSSTAHNVNVSINGNPLGVVQGNSVLPFSADFLVQTSFLIEGQNTLTVSTTSSSDLVLFDTVKINYARKHAADLNRVSFFTTGYRRSTVSGFTSANVRLFDVTSEGEPVQVTNLNVVQNGGTFEFSLPAYRSRIYYALEDTAPMTAASVIPNWGSSLATPAHTADLVIVSYGDFLTQAETWANYRRGQGLTVEVVDIADVFDEFSFGTSGSTAVTAFLNYAKTNWTTPPRYVLFIGDGSYDPRNFEGFGNQNLIPAKMVNTVYMETVSDEALADFNGDGLAELAVGRIPAKTGAEVTSALNNVIAFETPAMQDLNRGAVFAFDVPNGYDFEGMSHALASQLPAGMPKTFVARGLPAPNQMTPDPMGQTNLVNGLNAGMGRYIVNYSGHGTTGNWVNGAFFGVNNFNGTAGIPQVNNPNRSIHLMLTCLNGYFVNPSRNSLSEVMFKQQSTGSAANWASAGLTTPDVQLSMATRFYGQVALGNISRIGDLILDAKTFITGGTDVRLSWVLLGDPTLKIR